MWCSTSREQRESSRRSGWPTRSRESPTAWTPSRTLTSLPALVGSPQHIIEGRWSTQRYLYLMRRRADIAHDAYVDHYFHHHSDFARHLTSITAYNQIHIDQAASKDLAWSIGVGVHHVDSVSELSFESIEEFFAGMEPEALGAAEDELTFVDRANSVSFALTDTPLRAGGVTAT